MKRARYTKHSVLGDIVCVVMLGLLLAPCAFGQRTRLKPGGGGIYSLRNSSAIAYGASAAVLALQSGSNVGLKEATNQLIAELQRSNSGMRIAKDQGQIRLGGKTALWKILSNDSPIGGRETDWLITVLQPEGLVYFILVAPEQEFADYQGAFRQILNSVNFGSQ